ncbi:MAG: prephenate dehydrogenase [Aeromicrobium sp.]
MSEASAGSVLPGPVLIVGCGLIGTSVALALREHGVEVYLDDARPANVEVAVSRGAGRPGPVGNPGLVVVAVPPAAVPDVVGDALTRWPNAIVTDLASVKDDLGRRIAGLPGAPRYVGSHPMAGSERSGPMAASGRLFEGRAWAITASDSSEPRAVAAVRELATIVGAVIVDMDAGTHDEAVALVSHLPHLLSVLAAAQLKGAPDGYLALAGPGLRDVTRIAGSDTGLWLEILQGNAVKVSALLKDVRGDLDSLIAGLDSDANAIAAVLRRGREGTRLVPGRHGDKDVEMATVFVQIPDQPGELSRLMAHTGESGINIEDIRIDHELGRPVGIVEVAIAAHNAEALVEALTSRGWSAYR